MDGLALELAWVATGLGAVVAILAIVASLRRTPPRIPGWPILLGGLVVAATGAVGLLLPDAVVKRELDAATREISDGRVRSLVDSGEVIGPSLGLDDLTVGVSAAAQVGPIVTAVGGGLTIAGGIVLAARRRRETEPNA